MSADTEHKQHLDVLQIASLYLIGVKYRELFGYYWEEACKLTQL